jgi:hypothetical protein
MVMRMKVKRFDNGTASDDGKELSIDVILDDDERHTLVVPFRQIDWVSNAFLNLANAAYDRQREKGVFEPSNPIEPAMIAESFRVVPKEATSEALLQILGRKDAGAPRGIGSTLLTLELVRGLSERLGVVATQLTESRSKKS